MATYASYRHIELDKVGYSKKRVRNTPSEIFNVMNTSSAPCSPQSNGTPNRSRNHDSFNRLFGNTPDMKTPRRSSLTKQSKDGGSRNPVTGDGVDSWDSRPVSRSTPRPQRNPVTGEVYYISSPTTSPIHSPIKKSPNGLHNGIQKALQNGLSNGHAPDIKPMVNGKA